MKTTMLLKGMDREKAQLFLQQSIAQMCKVTVSFTGPIEIDGIICITGRDKDDLVLVKLHEKLTSPVVPDLDVSDGETEDAWNTGNKKKRTVTPDFCTPTESVAPPECTQEHFKSEGNHESCENEPHHSNVSELHSQTYKTEALPSTSGTLDIMALADDIKTEPILLDSDYEDGVNILDSPDESESGSFTDSLLSGKRTMSANFESTEPVAKVMNPGLQRDDVARPCVNNVAGGLDFDVRSLELMSAGTEPPMMSTDTSLSCSVCLEVFSGFKILQEHVSSVHQQHICRHCLQLFHYPHQLHRHMKLHRTTVHWVCTSCRHSFRRKEHLCHHISCHQNMQLHQCGQCEKRFTARSMLQRHLHRQHGGKTEYMCKPCFMEFTDAATFARHKNCHKQGDVQYACGQCAFTANDRLSVVKHGFVHFGLRVETAT